MTIKSDADLLDALRVADPAAQITLTTTEATAAVRRARPSRPPRRRWAIWTAAAAALIAVGAPVGAVATDFAARTGWFGSPNPGGASGPDSESIASTESDGTEWFDLDADDLPEVIASLFPHWLPLAPGVTDATLSARVTDVLTEMDGLGQETLILKTYEYEAYRDWIGAWIAAHDRGDVSGQERAAEALEEAASWPATVATDGGGIADSMRAFAERISAGDHDAAQALAQFEKAPGWDGIDRETLWIEINDQVTGAKG